MERTLLGKLSPTITNMIRMDHTHVLSAWHQIQPGTSNRVRQGLVDTLCMALEVHAQLEEEIFYPALREVSPDEVLDRSKPAHDAMRGHIRTLRQLRAGDAAFDAALHELMREVIHHVADEETELLPKAERLLAPHLEELGARMTRRRVQLVGPRAGELAGSMARSLSRGTLLAAAGGMMLARRAQHRGAGAWSGRSP